MFICRHFSYNIDGLITLEYAPFWLIGGLLSERWLMGKLEHLQWVEEEKIENDNLNEDNKKIKIK